MRRDQFYFRRRKGGDENVSIFVKWGMKNDDLLFLISSFSLSFVPFSLISHVIKSRWNQSQWINHDGINCDGMKWIGRWWGWEVGWGGEWGGGELYMQFLSFLFHFIHWLVTHLFVLFSSWFDEWIIICKEGVVVVEDWNEEKEGNEDEEEWQR